MASNVQHATKPPRPAWAKWYDRQLWRGPNGLRYVVLARDPVCRICQRRPSTVADHIKPHKGNWVLFCSLENLWGICGPCHDAKTAREDGGFGNRIPSGPPSDVNAAAITGEPGKQFQSSSVSSKKLDAALEGMEELLKDIPS